MFNLSWPTCSLWHCVIIFYIPHECSLFTNICFTQVYWSYSTKVTGRVFKMGSRKLFSFFFFSYNVSALLSKCLLHQNAEKVSFNKMNVCILNQYWILVRFFCFVVFLFCFVVCFFFVDWKLFFSIISEMTNSIYFGGRSGDECQVFTQPSEREGCIMFIVASLIQLG